MIPEQELYSQAVSAFQADDLAKARELFSQLLKIDRKNVDYWLWMSAAVETTKERIYCLREILSIDPENEEAAQGLGMLGEKTPELAPNPPSDPPFIPWKTQLELEDENPAGQRALGSRIALYSVLGLAIIALFGFGIYLALKPSQTASTSAIKRWTVTPLPSATETLTPNTSSTGPALFSIALDATFTATPVYVATPHNRYEAYSAGMRAYDKGDWVKAADYFKQVLVSEPNAADIYYHLGDVYRFQGAFENALSAYQNAINIDANFAPPYLGEAQVYLEGQPVRTDLALSALQKAVSLDPNLSQANLELANLMLAQNSPDAALDYLSRLDASMPNNAQVELDRAEAYLAKGNGDQALISIKKANQYDRSLLPVYLTWAKILQLNGDYNNSVAPLLTFLNYSPTNLSSKILLARAYFEGGDSEKAFALVNECLQQDNKFIEAYLLRADIYLSESQTDSARSDFNSALHVDYNNFDANVGLGRVLLVETLAGSAYNQFDFSKKLAKTDSQKAVLLYWQAASLRGLGEASAAIRDFNSALVYAGGALPQDLKVDAEKQLTELVTATPTPTLTKTPVPSKTPTPTPTPKKSATPRPSSTSTKK
jgi:tetratricopeptide (TPR) repeat protein